jgi:hypothetical protein
MALIVVVAFFAALAALSVRYGDSGFGHPPSKEEALAAFGFTWDDLTARPSIPEPRRAQRIFRALSTAARIAVGTLVSALPSSR